jgi:hypothetical protein
VKAVKSFFTTVFEAQDRKIVTRSSCDIRRELFKLRYIHDTFNIYSKADAFEAIDNLITIIHDWVSAQNKG